MTGPIRLPKRVGHVLLDRDGVLNRERAGGWISTVGDWEWESGAESGLDRIAEAGIRVSVVTNQSGIGRSSVRREDVDDLHRWLDAELRSRGIDVVGIFVCPHHPDDRCRCRKPAPGLIVDAIDASGIAPAETVLVGDDRRDLDAASAAGVAAVLVRTGKGTAVEGRGDWEGPVAEDLADAVNGLSLGRGGPRDLL